MTGHPPSLQSVKSIASLARGLDVLQLLQTSGALGLAELHRRSGIPKASLMRILKTLIGKGVVWQRMADGAYVPSYSLSELASHLDREAALVEAASPVLARLSERIAWPSVLAVPRLTHMEVIETNASRAYHDEIPLGPVGFAVNMLRSASGRAWIAACEDSAREAMLGRLRRSGRKGDLWARSGDYVDAMLGEVRAWGYAFRDPDFGGDYDEGRAVADDGRDSLGVAIRLGPHVPGAINVTWSKRALGREAAAQALAGPAIAAADEIAEVLSQGGRFTW